MLCGVSWCCQHKSNFMPCHDEGYLSHSYSANTKVCHDKRTRVTFLWCQHKNVSWWEDTCHILIGPTQKLCHHDLLTLIKLLYRCLPEILLRLPSGLRYAYRGSPNDTQLKYVCGPHMAPHTDVLYQKRRVHLCAPKMLCARLYRHILLDQLSHALSHSWVAFFYQPHGTVYVSRAL